MATAAAPDSPPQTATMSVRHAAVWAMASQYGSFAIQFVTSVLISRGISATPVPTATMAAAEAAIMKARRPGTGRTTGGTVRVFRTASSPQSSCMASRARWLVASARQRSKALRSSSVVTPRRMIANHCAASSRARSSLIIASVRALLTPV